jgi:hypothetical protein
MDEEAVGGRVVSTPPQGFTLTTDNDLNPTGQPNEVIEYVQLLVPTGQDVNYELDVTAYAQEEGTGDPDQASTTATQHIGIDFTHNETEKNFLANDQSIWGSGNAFSVDKSLFLGPNISSPVEKPVTERSKSRSKDPSSASSIFSRDSPDTSQTDINVRVPAADYLRRGFGRSRLLPGIQALKL